MEGKMVEHWQHGTGMVVRSEADVAYVLFEKDNRERMIALTNLTDESGRPLVSVKPVGPTKTVRERNMDTLYEHVCEIGKPVFTDYPSAARLMQELNSKGASFGSAGTITGYMSQLHKRGLVDYAEGVRGSGWVPVKGMC
jgi:hypothetical protein